jgi:biopolymer transport protein ExbD
MKIPRRPKHLGSQDGDTMTPMIDVVFLLLVFFICASVGGTADRLLPAELKGTTEAADPQEPAEDPDEWQHPAIQIRIEPEQDSVAIFLDEQRLTGPEMLQDRLQRLATVDPESRIILNIHDDVRVQPFIDVYDLCQSLKFQSISFAVGKPAATP